MNNRSSSIGKWLAGGGVLLAVAGLLLPLPALSAGQDVRVTVNSPAQISVDSEFAVTLDITPVENFDAALLRVDYDAAILKLARVDDGDIGGRPIPLAALAETTPGKAAMTFNIPGLEGASGEGRLGTVYFRAIAAGNSAIRLPIISISNNRAELLQVSTTDARVQVFRGDAPPDSAAAPLDSPDVPGENTVPAGGPTASGAPPVPPPAPADTTFLDWTVGGIRMIWIEAFAAAVILSLIIALVIKRRMY